MLALGITFTIHNIFIAGLLRHNKGGEKGTDIIEMTVWEWDLLCIIMIRFGVR